MVEEGEWRAGGGGAGGGGEEVCGGTGSHQETLPTINARAHRKDPRGTMGYGSPFALTYR